MTERDEFGAIEAEVVENTEDVTAEDVMSAIGIAVDPMSAALQRATGQAPNTTSFAPHKREEVKLVDGKLVKVVEYTNEDIMKKLDEIDKKLDLLLGNNSHQATVKMEIK